MSEPLPEAWTEATNVVIQQLRAENQALKTDIAEWEQSFDLYNSAMRRGDQLWQKHHPMAHPHVLPDAGMLVAWLLELVAKAEGAVDGPGKGSAGGGGADASAYGEPRGAGGTRENNPLDP